MWGAENAGREIAISVIILQCLIFYCWHHKR